MFKEMGLISSAYFARHSIVFVYRSEVPYKHIRIQCMLWNSHIYQKVLQDRKVSIIDFCFCNVTRGEMTLRQSEQIQYKYWSTYNVIQILKKNI